MSYQMNPLEMGNMLRSTGAPTERLVADSRSLAQLRAEAKASPDKALKAAAQQFEAIFLNMMLKSMRDATPQDGMFDSEQTKMFTGMLDQQFSQNMASKGIGLADVMVRQLSSNQGGIPSASTLSNPLVMPKHNSTPQEFIDRMMPEAKKASEASGVPTSLMLSQAALESGWGKNEIRMPDGNTSHNLFGIKAGEGWKGKVAEVTTTEYQDGVPHKQVERFRAYASYADAFQDYANLIGNDPRYAGVLKLAGNEAGMAQAVQASGYATDPQYADKLQRIMGMMKLAG